MKNDCPFQQRAGFKLQLSITKHKLSEEFLAALCADFEKNGKHVIENVHADKST
jgi:hypothetical protein